MTVYEKLWYNCEITGKRYIYNSTLVVLVDGGYDASVEDPVQDTEFECEGLVVGPSGEEEYPLQVDWSNGCSNQYRSNDLFIVGHIPVKQAMEEDNPNKTFKIQKYKVQQTKDANNIGKIAEVIKSTGASISEASRMLNEHDGDLPTAITRLNLKGLPAKVRELMDETGVSIAEARRTLEESAGDYASALEYIRQNQEPPQTGLNQHATTENLPKIDRILNATGLSLTKARELLHYCGNNVDAAIEHYDSNRNNPDSNIDEWDISFTPRVDSATGLKVDPATGRMQWSDSTNNDSTTKVLSRGGKVKKGWAHVGRPKKKLGDE